MASDKIRMTVSNESGKWEVWDYAYNDERGDAYYQVHEFYDYKEALRFLKLRCKKVIISAKPMTKEEHERYRSKAYKYLVP